MDIHEMLEGHADPAYRDFISPLLPTVDKSKIIGVRIPDIRKIARAVGGSPEAEAFLRSLPHALFDEDQLHAALIEATAKSAEDAIEMIDAFLPYVDNWSTADSRLPRCLRKDLPLVYGHVKRWMESSHVYTRRFSITVSMKLFLDGEDFKKDLMEEIALASDEDYYIMMASAWYWAEALYRQREHALPYLTSGVLNAWIHDKAISKAVESRHFTMEEKEYFRTLKRR